MPHNIATGGRKSRILSILVAVLALCVAVPPHDPSHAQEPTDAKPPTVAASSVSDEEAPAKKRSKRKKKRNRKELEAAIDALPPQYRLFLFEVHFLISDEERDDFLEITEDYQRDAWIERFWRVRDTYPDTPRNEFREHWAERLHYAKQEFSDLRSDRAKIFLLNGPPDARVPFRCTGVTWPLEIWYYRQSERVGYEFLLIFARTYGRPEYRMYHPGDGMDRILDFRGPLQEAYQEIYTCKDGNVALAAIQRINNNMMEFTMLVAKIERPATNPSPEWLATFDSYSTVVPEGAQEFSGELDVEFPARYQNRTVMNAQLTVPVAEAAKVKLANHEGYNFNLTGEVLTEDGVLFENFQYKFDFLAADVEGDVLPMSFQRRLRPGKYRLIVKLEDLNHPQFFRASRELDVPTIDREAELDPETQKVLDSAEAVLRTSELPTVELIEPQGELQTGYVRFETITTGDIAEMVFSLGGNEVLRKRRAPFSAELDLGQTPRNHILRATAYDREGVEVASDEIVINAGRNRFAVRFVEPREGVRYQEELQAEVDIQVPDGDVVERLELFVNDVHAATLFQPPYTQLVSLPGGADQIAYLRAAAFLTDGNSTDAVAYVNAPDYLEIVDIEYVELYATALDKQGHPITDLEAAELQIFEDGTAQQIRRFERVDDLPIHVQVMIDVSASMKENVSITQQAALEFLETTITPKDRAAVVTFNDYPYLGSDFTNDLGQLAGALAGLRAERGTALYDALVFGLYYLNGLKGQRAILLLSDGKDEASRFKSSQALEYARRSGVSIYSIGLDIKGKSANQAKKDLRMFADETGGRAFFIDSIAELASIYQIIQDELRSRYFVTYQSTNSDGGNAFRSIETSSTRRGVEIKTLRGYYP